MSNNSINILPEEEDENAIYPANEVVILTEQEPYHTASMDPIENTEHIIYHSDIDNENLLVTMINQNREFIEENKRLREINNKIYEHFTKEFVSLKRSIDQTLGAMKRQRTLCSKLPNLPCTEVSEVLDFEKLLQNDEEVRQELITKFERQPIDDLKKFIVGNLKYIYNNDSLASKFSWTSVNKNIAVKDFIIIKLLKESCMQNIPQTNYGKIEETLKKLFNGAKDRITKHTKRTNRKALCIFDKL